MKEQPSDARCDWCGGVGLRQLRQVQPITAQTLLGAEVDVVGEGVEPANDVHVGHSEGTRVVVLLANAEERFEL